VVDLSLYVNNDGYLKVTNLSLPINGLSAFRGSRKTEFFPYPVNGVAEEGYGVTFCPHNATHLDLPWCIDWNSNITKSCLREDLRLERRIPLDPEQRRKWILEHVRPKILNSVILNFTDLVDNVSSYIETDKWGVNKKHVRSDLNPTDLKELLDILHIKAEDIKAKIDSINTKNKLLIIHTGWFKGFYEYNQNYSDPLNDGFRLYLAHPYLSTNEMLTLIKDCAIEGIASDTLGLDAFVYHLPSREACMPYLKPIFENSRSSFPQAMPVHVSMLSQGKLLIENVTNLEKIQKKDERVTEIPLYVFPVQMASIDACLLQIFAPQR